MDFGAAIQTWINVLTHPGEAVFNEERSRPQATAATAVIWIVIAAVITGVLGWIQVQVLFGSGSQITNMIEQMNLPPDVAAEMEGMMSSGMLSLVAGGSGLASIIITPIMFLIGSGLLHLIARMFGGTGEFGRFAYLLAAIQAPVNIISAILGFVPILGGCIGVALGIYSLVLTFFAIKVEHTLSDGRAIGTLLVPVVLFFLIFACGIASVAGLFFSMQQGM